MFCMLCGVRTEAVALVRLVDACSRHTVSVVESSLASFGIGLNWQGLNSLVEEGWLTKLKVGGVPGADV